MAEADSFISLFGYELSLATPWFDIHYCPSELTAWPSPLDSYNHWLDRVVAEKREEWKRIGIYDMILLSKKEIHPNFELLYNFLSFWNMSANVFCSLAGMIDPTLYDVVAITGLPVDGDEVLFLHDALDIDLGFQVNKKNNVDSIFMHTFIRGSGPVCDIKHQAFLLFWICHFFICTSLVAVVVEFGPYISAILSRSYLNIGLLFLSLMYKGMFTLLHWIKKGKSMKTIFGPFWFLQL